jgi:hypothetical protein
MLHLRIMMRSGGCVAFSQDTDYAGAGGGQEFGPPVHDERYGLPGMDVCTRLFEGLIYGQARRVLETTFFGYRDVSGGSKELWNMWLRARRTIGDSSRVFSRR